MQDTETAADERSGENHAGRNALSVTRRSVSIYWQTQVHGTTKRLNKWVSMAPIVHTTTKSEEFQPMIKVIKQQPSSDDFRRKYFLLISKFTTNRLVAMFASATAHSIFRP